MWRRRWQAEGVFCVLYSEPEGTCAVGERFLDTAEYALSGSGAAARRSRSLRIRLSTR